MTNFPVGDNAPFDVYPVTPSLDGTELIAISNKGTLDLYVPLSSIAMYVTSFISTNSSTVTASPYAATDIDRFIFIRMLVNGVCTVNLGSASARNGLPVYIKDVKGITSSYNVTINSAGTDVFEDGSTSFILRNDFQGQEFFPVYIGTQWTWVVR